MAASSGVTLSPPSVRQVTWPVRHSWWRSWFLCPGLSSEQHCLFFSQPQISEGKILVLTLKIPRESRLCLETMATWLLCALRVTFSLRAESTSLAGAAFDARVALGQPDSWACDTRAGGGRGSALQPPCSCPHPWLQMDRLGSARCSKGTHR